MTDAEVTHRVEQAMLGAMLARPRSAAQLGVGPEHFADQRHQAIAAALTGNAGTERGLLGRLIGFFTRHGRAAREAAEYMDTLPGLCPEPAHIGTYFRMLAADHDQRAAQAQARVHEQGSQVLDVAAERLGQLRGRPDPSTGMPRVTARLARALRDRTDGQREQAARSRPQAPPSQAAAPRAQVPQQGNGQPAQTASAPAAQSGSVPAPASAREASEARPRREEGAPFGVGGHARPEDIQDAILAALMRHPGEAREITGWLTPQAFTGQRRELYTLIRQYDSAGRDIDPVTLAWGAAQPAPDQQQQNRLRPEFILGLGRTRTVPGAAAVLGKTLLADQVLTRELGPDWHLAPHQEPARQNQQGPQNEPGPKHEHASEKKAEKKQDQPKPEQQGNGPYRQGRPGNEGRRPARSGARPGTAPVVPGTLMNPPPPAPGQDGMSPHQ